MRVRCGLLIGTYKAETAPAITIVDVSSKRIYGTNWRITRAQQYLDKFNKLWAQRLVQHVAFGNRISCSLADVGGKVAHAGADGHHDDVANRGNLCIHHKHKRLQQP